jgi:hypothetical protein
MSLFEDPTDPGRTPPPPPRSKSTSGPSLSDVVDTFLKTPEGMALLKTIASIDEKKLKAVTDFASQVVLAIIERRQASRAWKKVLDSKGQDYKALVTVLGHLAKQGAGGALGAKERRETLLKVIKIFNEATEKKGS